MSWKGHIYTTKTYTDAYSEIKDIAGGFAFGEVLATFIDDLRKAVIPKEFTFVATDDSPVKIAHGFDRKPQFVAIKSFCPEVYGEGDLFGVSIKIVDVDDTNIHVEVISPGKVEVTLIALRGTKYL